MALRFLLDTNVISEPVNRSPNEGVLSMLEDYAGEVAISATVWHELQFGCQRLPESRRRSTIERYLEDVVLGSIPILAYDQQAAEWHSTERTRLTGIGLTPPFADAQIAAVAIVNNLTLVTANIKDFQAFEGLSLVNWHTPTS